MIYLFLANGFEEIEGLTALDVLRRAGEEIMTVGIGSERIVGSHKVPVICDTTVDKIEKTDDLKAVILPGGMPGTLNLEADKTVQEYIDFANEKGALVCAICAAPSILGHKGLLQGKKAVCFPGFEKELVGADICENGVVRDGNIITAKGMGVSLEFGLEILAVLQGKEKADAVKAAVQSN